MLRLPHWSFALLVAITPALAQTPPADKKAPKSYDSVVVSAGLPKGELEKENQARVSLQKGREAYEKSGCGEALPQFLSAVEAARQMNKPRVLFYEALAHASACHAQLEQWGEAGATMLQRAEEMRELAGAREYNPEQIYLAYAYQEMEQQNWKTAEEQCRKAVGVYDWISGKGGDERTRRALAGEKAVTLMLLGIILRKQQRLGEALQIWDQAYELGSHNVMWRPPEHRSAADELAEITRHAIGVLELSADSKALEKWRLRAAHVRELKVQ